MFYLDSPGLFTKPHNVNDSLPCKLVLIILKKYPTQFRDECSVIDSNCAACTNKAECGFCYVEFTNNGTEGLGSCVAVREDDPEEPEYGRWVRRRERQFPNRT